MKKLLFLTLISGIANFMHAQTNPNNCGNYTTTGSVLISGYTDPNPACGANVPGTIGSGPAYWDGAGCGGQLISTVVGPPVTCLSLAYTAVNTDDYATITTNTGGVLTITTVNCGVSGNVIGPYNCGSGFYGTCGVTVCSTVPFTQVILSNTGCSSGWVIDCGTPVLSCAITNFTANVGACVAGPNTYSTTGQVTFSNAPVSGQLIVEDCNGVQQIFNPPFVSPVNYTLTGQNANGAACDVTAYFTADPACTQTMNYTAPICVCNIDNFTANIGACQSNNTFDVTGTVTYSSPPAGGSLVVEVNNGGTIYSTTISPPFTSPDNYTITGIPSNGNNITITTYFTSNPACTNTINSTAPPSCACNADIGTYTATITGSSTNNYVLCYGDQIDITTNNDFTAPDEQFAPPGPPYDPGVSWLMYSCPPTVALTPDPFNTVPSDPCFLGLVSDMNFSDVNDLFWINSYPAGTFTNNTVYFVPITMYSMSGGTYSYVNTTMPCYELGTPFAIQYLPDFSFTLTEDCATTSATATLNGGMPELMGGNFTASNLLPVTASFSNTTCGNGGTITITGLNGGDMYSFTVTDGNGCPYTVSGGPYSASPTINAGLDQTVCAGTPVTLTATGAGVGGTYSWDNGVTNGVAFTPASTTTYTVTGTASNGCSSIDQVVVTVNPIPVVNAGPDQTLCAGDATVLNGSGATTYVWDNGVTNGVSFTPAATTTYTVTGTTSGCSATDQVVVTVNPLPAVNAGVDQTICVGDPVTLTGTGAGVGGTYSWTGGVTNGVAFSPAATTTYTVTGTDANLCVNTDQVIVNVNPLDDPSFTYPLGLTYCQTGTDPVANITGLAGGAFSYTVVSGGPNLVLNTATGGVTLATSDIGTYAITYNTATAPGSLCPQTTTLNLTITDNPIADFTFGTYCTNNADPSPTFINGGTGGVFTAAPAGLSINAGTGVVDLSASTPGTYTVTNTVNVPGCALATYNDDIVVNGLPNANISGTTSICPGAPLPDITINLTAGTANWDVTYEYNGNPVTVNAASSPYTITGAAVGSYDLVSVTDANGCTNLITGNATISNYPVPTMNPLVQQDVCEGTNLSVQGFGADIAGSTFAWTNTTGIDVGFGLSGTGNIPIFLAQNSTGADIFVTISVVPTSPQGCVGPASTFVIGVHPNPVVTFFADSLMGCEPFTTMFYNTSSVPGQNCLWDFGTGPAAFGCDSVPAIFGAGIYDVTLSVTTADGCFGTATIADYIVVYEQAEASFIFAPQIIDIDDTEVEFLNQSQNADWYQWDFGDTTPYVYQINPSHIYPTVPNQYLVTLVATNSGFCPDTAQQLVIIQDVIVFYVPNVFTPDHDEFNEGFQPVFTSGFDPFDYHLTIFNRWGEVVFESFNAEVGWDGTYSNQGLVQDGVYVWQIEFKENMSDKRHTHRGHVTVLK